MDPSQQNVVFNVERLRNVIAKNRNITLWNYHIGSSTCIRRPPLNRKNKCFYLPPDNIVYSAFESIVQAAAPKDTIFISDVERLKDGALGACGMTTSQAVSGCQNRGPIIKENPATIPLNNTKLTIGATRCNR
jgi:putative ABC transport system permease protein